MRLDAMSSWRPQPGRVVLWKPTASCVDATATAPVQPGPPSYLQGDHLAAFAALRDAGREADHRAWTGTATELDVVPRHRLATALCRFVQRHEGLRTWFDLDGAEPVRHCVAAEHVAFEPHELDLDPADPGWRDRLPDLLGQTFSARCRPDRWPGFCLVSVESDTATGLAWACDHAFTDGASQLMVPGELAGLLADDRGGVVGDTAVEPPVAGFPTYAADERARGEGIAADAPDVEEWVELVRRAGGDLPRFPLDLGLALGETAPVRVRVVDLLRGREVEDFEERCREAGGRMTGGVVAALAEAERRLTGRDDWWGVTVLSTRDADTATSHGWFCTFAPLRLEAADQPGVLVRVPDGQAAFERAKRLGAVPVHVVLARLVESGVLEPSQVGSPQLVSYLDLRRLPGAGTPAFERAVHFTGEGRTGNASVWVNRDDDRLYLLAQTPDTEQAQAAVDAHHEALREVLVEAVSGAAARR